MKRKTQEEDHGKKQQRIDGEGDNEFRVLIENNQVGVIIGKGGSNVTRVRETTGVSLRILKAATADVAERILNVKGSVANSAEALKMIAELLMGTSADGGGSATIRLLAQQSATGALIGKAGAHIKETQAETGARIQISAVLPESTEKTVNITGTAVAIQKALLIVLACLRDDPLRTRPTASRSYVPGRKATTTTQPFPHHHHHHKHQHHHPPHHPPHHHQQQHHHQHRPSYASLPSYTHPHYPPPQSMQYAPPVAPPAPAGPLYIQKIGIPTICAGCVIGKNGRVINDIRERSSTNISIADPDSDNPEERVATLTGQPKGIKTAIQLIKNKVESYLPKELM